MTVALVFELDGPAQAEDLFELLTARGGQRFGQEGIHIMSDHFGDGFTEPTSGGLVAGQDDAIPVHHDQGFLGGVQKTLDLGLGQAK